MASKDIITNLIAKDQMSGPLRKIATEADNVDEALESTGKTATTTGSQVEKAGTQGAKGIQQLGDAADKSRARIDAMNVGLAVLGAGLTKAGDLARREEQQVIGLTRAFGDAADEMLEFAQTLDDLTMFSDDDIRAGERFFASLRNNYDLSIDQIKELMQITADLASASGVSFEDASSRVTAAIRGEGEAAEYLGLTMNQQSIDRQNLTLTMSNQEAAQFRLNALMEQSAMYQGAAADMNRSSAGTLAEWTDTAEDAGAAIGGFVGPLATMATGVGTLSLGMAGLGLNANVLGKGLTFAAAGARTFLGAIGPVGWAVLGLSVAVPVVTKLFGDSGNSMDDASMSADDLSQSMAGLNAIIKETSLSGDFFLAGQMRAWVNESMAALTELDGEIEHHKNTWNSMITDGLRVGEGWSANDVGTWITGNWGEELEQANLEGVISDFVYNSLINGEADALSIYDWGMVDQWMDGLIAEMIPDEADAKRVSEAMAPIFDLMTNPSIDSTRLAENYQEVWDAFDDHGSVDQLVADLEALEEQTVSTTQAAQLFQSGDYYRMLGQDDIARAVTQLDLLEARAQGVNAVLSSGEQQAYAESWEGINEAIEEGSAASTRIIGELTALESQLNDGVITQEQYAQGVVDIYLNIERYEREAANAAATTNALTNAMSGAQVAISGTSDEQERLNAAMAGFNTLMGDVNPLLETAVANAVSLAASMKEIREEASGLGQAANIGITPFVEDMKLLEETLAGILELTGNGDFLSQWNMSGFASDASLAAEAINDLSAGLDTTFRVVVGNTDALGSQMQGIKDWSDELIGDPGVWAEIDHLYNEGRISLEKYNEAQQAQVDITNANATVQRDLLAIQAAQAPMLADNSTHLAKYVEEIRQMNDGYDDAEDGALRQLEALGWMDEATVTSAMNIATFADQLDGLAGGEDAFRQMVDGAVALNPALLPVLETMGYIENLRQNSDGTWEYDVNINGGDEAMSEIQMLNQSIVDLVDALDDGKLNGSYTMTFNVEDNATPEITRTKREYDDFDGSTATGYLNADGSDATGTIGVVDESLDALDGSEAWVYAYAQDNASSVLSTLANTWGGVIATSWIDVVTRNVPGNQLGGVVQQYARGGVLTELAEAGPEILHFANGGTAYVGQRGIYAVEPGTYVSPNNAVSNSYGGTTVNVYVQGSVTTERDLTHSIARAISAELAGGAEENWAGYGGAA